MTKNSKKTESENSENAKSTFSAITNHLVDSWEKRREKNLQRKQSELEKKAKRSKKYLK